MGSAINVHIVYGVPSSEFFFSLYNICVDNDRNVAYNIKNLFALHYIHHECEINGTN